MCIALITGPRKTNWNKKVYSSFIVLFSAGERGREKTCYFNLKRREDELKLQIMKHK